MRGRIRSVDGHERAALSAGWELATAAPGAIIDVESLASAAVDWVPAEVPGTVASALRAAGTWSLDGPARRFDADDVWYRTHFASSAAAPGERVVLTMGGLATRAEVWLNGERLLASESMFVEHAIDVTGRVGAENDLAIRFASLDAELAKKRPRPRWRAPMIEHPQLRWHRTTLLGRTPGWSPPAAPVGPWRPVALERRRRVAVSEAWLGTRVQGGAGVVDASVLVSSLDRPSVERVALVLERGAFRAEASLVAEPGSPRFVGRLVVPAADLETWWPHTHGEPALYRASLHVDGVRVDLGAIGLRELEVETLGGDFGVTVGGARVFCRGACWAPLDPVTLAATAEATLAAVQGARGLGMNMLRVPGTMVYESDAFYDACDREGVLVFQDLMFANMDYPADPTFEALALDETRDFLARMAGRPSLAVVCGNSEVEQQAAMWGAPRELWSPPLFHTALAAASEALCPHAQYWPSSAHGGAFPHQNDVCTTSYYGVGAYLRPLEDARRSGVRFATECLAFSNVPEPAAIHAMPGGEAQRVHHASWRVRAPRDLGAGWDFEDVRDHYLRALFRVEPAELRARDHDRYLALSRVVTGEVMAATFSEWRRAGSATNGAMVWLLRDLWLGAGWGVLDASGAPKAAARYLSRVLQPQHLSLSDEGTNGVYAHVVNERPEALDGDLVVTLFRGAVVVARAERALAVAGRGAMAVPTAGLFEGLYDTSYAYRFGPPSHDLVHARLRPRTGPTLEAFHFPCGLPAEERADVGLSALVEERGPGVELVLQSVGFAQSVHVQGEGLRAADDYFHVAPGGERRVALERVGPSARFMVKALNASSALQLRLPEKP